VNLSVLKGYYSDCPPFLKNLYALLPWSLRMGPEYRRTLRFLDTSLHWSAQEWQTYQQVQLRYLLSFCQKNVPYYSDIFAVHGIDPGADDIWHEYHKIPFIDRQEVATNVNRFLPRCLDISKLYYSTTGGTTGKPVHIYYDGASYAREWAYKLFFWNLAIGYTPKYRMATFRGVSFGDHLYIENPIYNEIRFSPFHLDSMHITRIVEKLEEYNPMYLHGYPSAVEALARHCLSKNITFKDVRGVMLISENIYDYQKSVIMAAFSCPIYSFYGHTERLVFASMDETLDGYIVHPAYGIAELIYEDGTTISQNSCRGEIVGSGFINTGMPLLRYRTGDYSYWKNDALTQLNMPVLGEIKGRWSQEYLIGSNGERTFLTALNMHSDAFANIRRMQFYQDKPGIVQINIVPETNYDQSDESMIRRQLKMKLGATYEIRFSYVDCLERTAAGKVKYLIQHLKA